jgi:hypothetical protein
VAMVDDKRFTEVVRPDETITNKLVVSHFKNTGVNEYAEEGQRVDLIEFTDFKFKVPFVVSCKGNSELIIYNVSYKNRTMIFPLDEAFTGFVDMDLGEDIEQLDLINFKKLDKLGRDEPMEMQQTIKERQQLLKLSHKVVVTFLSFADKKYYINKLVLVPHGSEFFKDQVCVLYKTKRPFN